MGSRRAGLPVLLAVLLAAPSAHAASRPDLVVSRVSVPTAAVAAGAPLSATDTTRNRGRAAAKGTTTRWYLSTDRRRGVSDMRMSGRRRVRALRRGRSQRGAALVRVPAAVTAGSYFLLACADDTRRVRESNERNNCRASAARLPVGAGPPPPGGGGLGPPPTPPDPPVIGGCKVFPDDNPWNRDVSADPVDPLSDAYVRHIGSADGDPSWNLRQDWGAEEQEFGIPFVVVPEAQPLAPIAFGVDGEDYGDESDPGPYPFPHDIPIEGGNASNPDPGEGDRHAIALRQGDCTLFETYATLRTGSPGSPSFRVASAAKWDLRSNALRTPGFTSADAAGLPILPGLARVDEVLSGKVTHALRFTGVVAQRAYIAPAGHFGPHENPCFPPYGARFRLKASFDTSGYTGQARVILDALKRYGLYFADQGSSGFISGTSDPRWDIDNLRGLRDVKGTDLEVVQSGAIVRGYETPGCSG